MSRALLAIALPVVVGLGSSVGRAAPRASAVALERVNSAAPVAVDEAERAKKLERGLSGQLAVALGAHPDVQADFARWHAASAQISAAGTLPSPTVELGVFVRAIETRTGPQVARMGVRQAFPWPAGLLAAGDGARAGADAAGARFQATVLAVAQQVEDAHWALWSIRTLRTIHTDHRELVKGLSETVRGRVEVGEANLSHLQQIDLTLARLSDDIARMDEAEAAAEARLRAAVGVWSQDALGTPEAPGGPWLPDEELMLLEAAASAHPRLQEARHGVAGAEAVVQGARAARLPGVVVGADWILVGPSTMDGVDPAQSGRDALSLGVGVQVPLWQKSAAERVTAAESLSRAARATVEGRTLDARAALHGALAEVEATGRRISVVKGTLLPQARAAYSSLLGTYTTGASTVAQALLAQQALLELRVELVRVQADHARALAALDAVCGREVQTRRRVKGERP